MIEVTMPAKLVATRSDRYTSYVFKNTDTGEYIICTRLPNWQTPEVFLGDDGFLQLESVHAGDKYFSLSTLREEVYLYTNIYFKNFVKKADIENSEIIL